MIKHNTVPVQLPLLDPVSIKLSNGEISHVDLIDADLSTFRWCPTGGKYHYPQRRIGGVKKGKLIFMHRVIMERILGRPLKKNEMPDHVDNNPLNNCRSNLRLATKTRNAQNSKKRSDNVSGYKGVARNYKSPHPWRAVIKVDGKQITLGYFDDPEMAYAAYCEAAKRYFGEYARLE